MKNFCCYLFISFSFIIFGQSQENEKSNFDLASKFSPTNIAKLVHSTSVRPHWLKKGNKFWYQYKTTNGSKYYIIDADRKTKSELFDNDKMAAWLTEITKDPYDAKHLPRFNFKFVKNETAMLTTFNEVDMQAIYDLRLNYKKDFERKGMIFSGLSPNNNLPEIIELKNHPWFIGVQFHPEFKSRPLSPHPLFSSFIKAAKSFNGK